MADPDEYVAEFAALAALAEAFTDLVSALHHQDQATVTPDRVVDLASRCMPRSQHVSLVVADHDHVHDIAATSDLPAAVDRIREETAEGPALDVLETNDLVVANDLPEDPRWPLFGARVLELTRIRSIVSYRLYFSPRHRAALSFYSSWPHAFGDLAIATGAIFAAYASLTVSDEVLGSGPVTPKRTADVHREIGVAIGILMSTDDTTTESAYRRLHTASKDLRSSLSDVAQHVIAHRRVPDGERG